MTDVTNTSEFKPTPAMRFWLITAINNGLDDISKISDLCNISRMSWYRWNKDPEFKKWFKKEWDNGLNMLSWKLDTIGFKKAENDFKYWEAMQKRVGNLQNTSNNVNNTFNTSAFKVEFICDED